MEVFIAILVIIILWGYDHISNLKAVILKNENELKENKKELIKLNTLSEILIYSDYWMGYLTKWLSLIKNLKTKNNQQRLKELQKYDEPRIRLIHLKERKEIIRKFLRELDYDTLTNLEFFLLVHGIESDWVLESDVFFPTFSYIKWHNSGIKDSYLDSSWEYLSHSPMNDYIWDYGYQELYIFSKTQHLISLYFYSKYKDTFDAVSVIEDFDEFDYTIINNPVKQRYILTVDIKALTDSIPQESRGENNTIYISSKHESIFDALVFKKNDDISLPEYIKKNDDENEFITTKYILQFIWPDSANIQYVKNWDLTNLKDILKKKRKKLSYEKEVTSVNWDKLTLFITNELYLLRMDNMKVI